MKKYLYSATLFLIMVCSSCEHENFPGPPSLSNNNNVSNNTNNTDCSNNSQVIPFSFYSSSCTTNGGNITVQVPQLGWQGVLSVANSQNVIYLTVNQSQLESLGFNSGVASIQYNAFNSACNWNGFFSACTCPGSLGQCPLQGGIRFQ